MPNETTNPAMFADPSTDFAAQSAKLARRRQLAEQLVAQGMSQDIGQGYRGGKVFIVGNPLGNVASSVGGAYINNDVDQQQAQLNAQDAAARRQFMVDNNMENLAAGDNTSLRGVIEKQVGQQLDYPRQREIEAARLASEQARIEAQDKRQTALFGQQTELLDKRLQGQKDLRQIPTVHITNSGSKDPEDVALDRQLKLARIESLKNPKPVASERKAALAQDDLVSRIDNALSELDRNPNAVGLRTMVPNIALNRVDPEGTAARAALGELSAEKAHEIYGASFTAAERTRADKFIPADGDDLHTVRTKLNNMKKLAEKARARAVGQQPKTPTTAQSGNLTAAEQSELDQLRAKFGRK